MVGFESAAFVITCIGMVMADKRVSMQEHVPCRGTVLPDSIAVGRLG